MASGHGDDLIRDVVRAADPTCWLPVPPARATAAQLRARAPGERRRSSRSRYRDLGKGVGDFFWRNCGAYASLVRSLVVVVGFLGRGF